MHFKNYLFSLFLFIGFTTFAQDKNQPDETKPQRVLYPTNFFISEPARDFPQDLGTSILENNIIPRGGVYTTNGLSEKRIRKLLGLEGASESSSAVDPLAQGNLEPLHYTQNRAPITSFEDTDYTASPPDPSMAVGPNHIVTMGNTKWSVFDKAGNVATGFPKNLNNPLQAPGSTRNAGDPVVMYDREADRWFISQFQLPVGNAFLIGISTTPDPTGSYYVYEFELGAGNDYPHYGVWGDSYVTAGNFAGTEEVFTFNRNKMLAGDATAEIVGFSLPNYAELGFNAAIPVHSEAAGVATGPIKIVFYQDDAFSGVTSDHVGLWNINMNWNNIASSTVSTKNIIPTNPFDSLIAGGFANIAQPGTSQRIDAIVGAVMNMSHWYEFGDYQSIVLNWVVEVTNGSRISGIRWVELRSTDNGVTWTNYQEGTFTDPTGNESVFMGCIGMDKNGSIGLGYTKSGSTTFPSIYYTGRQAGDPLGIMTYAEELAMAGTSSVTVNDRYGDYGQGVRDPIDDETFWVTSEYSGNARNVRVYSYKLDINPDVCSNTSTYANSSWNRVPTSTSNAIINANYNTATAGSIDACSITINAGRTLTIGSSDYINIQNNIINNGNIIVISEYDAVNDLVKQGSIVQTNSAATTTNNGNISIQLATPPLDGFDFMVLGSPMSAETRAGVFGNAIRVRNHTTSLFTPNMAVAATNPTAGNWVDEEGDDWSRYNGTLNPAEGYMVIQSLTEGAEQTYNMTFTNGTLNNGNYTYAAGYNGTQNASPNIMANPYPSPIDGEALINANPGIVDALYFWEHKIAVSAGTPGPYGRDYSMDDISIFNLTGSTSGSVSNPSNVPNGIIASGQGFGIKALASGNVNFTNAMRVKNGNTTLRRPINKDRIWLHLQNNNYTSLKSSTLIGFIEGATNGYDTGYDAIRNASSISLYSLDDNKDELSIQARNAFALEEEVPMGFNSQIEERNSYTISISDIEGENLENITVYLKDNYTGITTNLSQESYEFKSENGNYNDRFILTFKNNALSTIAETLAVVEVYPNPSNNVVYVNSAYSPLKSVVIYDLQGRVVLSKNIQSKNSESLDISKLNPLVYFVEINTASGSVTKRLVKQ